MEIYLLPSPLRRSSYFQMNEAIQTTTTTAPPVSFRSRCPIQYSIWNTKQLLDNTIAAAQQHSLSLSLSLAPRDPRKRKPERKKVPNHCAF